MPNKRKQCKSWTSSSVWKFYFQNISIPRKTFPYYGIGQNYGNWIFHPFFKNHFVIIFTIFPKLYFHTMEEVWAGTKLGMQTAVIWITKHVVAMFIINIILVYRASYFFPLANSKKAPASLFSYLLHIFGFSCLFYIPESHLNLESQNPSRPQIYCNLMKITKRRFVGYS